MTGTAIASLIALAAGSTYAAYESYSQGKAAQEDAEYQAKLENIRASNEQIKGEQEMAKRSRQLSADIGSAYANWAGNGLMVDGASKDTLGSILNTQVAEGQADINTIKDNTAMNVWTHTTNANKLLWNGEQAYKRGRNSAIAGLLTGAGHVTNKAYSIWGNN